MEGEPRTVFVEGCGVGAAADAVGDGVPLLVKASTVGVPDDMWVFSDGVEGHAVMMVDCWYSIGGTSQIVWEDGSGP